MSDKQYDALYDELVSLEEQSHTVLSNSPTQKVQGKVLDGFVKVPHTKPMLSRPKNQTGKRFDYFFWGINRAFYPGNWTD